MHGKRQRVPDRSHGLRQERRGPAAGAPADASSSSTADAEIEGRTGVDIAYIFEREGEAGFREREKEVLDELSRRASASMATGGGAVLDGETRSACASAAGSCIFGTSVDQQLARTRHGTHRPLLNNADPRGTLER